jgi:hypothetical protein
MNRQDEQAEAQTDLVDEKKKSEKQQRMDKTLADSYPASDPPSSIPDPSEDPSSPADEGELS